METLIQGQYTVQTLKESQDNQLKILMTTKVLTFLKALMFQRYLIIETNFIKNLLQDRITICQNMNLTLEWSIRINTILNTRRNSSPRSINIAIIENNITIQKQWLQWFWIYDIIYQFLYCLAIAAFLTFPFTNLSKTVTTITTMAKKG